MHDDVATPSTNLFRLSDAGPVVHCLVLWSEGRGGKSKRAGLLPHFFGCLPKDLENSSPAGPPVRQGVRVDCDECTNNSLYPRA